MNHRGTALWGAAAAALLGLYAAASYGRAVVWAAQIPRVDFVQHIQPIFERSCLPCHGPQKQMVGLRLDLKEAALKGGISGPILVPGHSEESLLYLRVAGLEDLKQMPLEGEPLSGEEIDRIRRWIDQGADWPEGAALKVQPEKRHWAYQKPVRPDPPAVKNSSWVRNPIDHFVLARLEAEGLQPSPQARPETLIRRVTLDLIGLPPSPQEVDAFLADRSPDAYERLVDRLLASPHYGERWARPWLDWARYADSHGYEKDRPRSMWLYRDWVVKALNQDMPFDRFTIEQIAGDLLPEAGVEQKIATGFHRNTMINEEGGVDPEEYRIAAIVDRVDATASLWLGTTLACAQCHDHKYDPFTQKEYYRFFAFFNTTEPEVSLERGNERVSRGPLVRLPSPAYLSAHRHSVEDEIVGLETVLRTPTPELEAEQKKWEQEVAGRVVRWNVLEPVALVSVAGAKLERLEDGSILVSGKNPEKDAYVVLAETAEKRLAAIRLEALTHSSLPQGASGRSAGGNFVLTGFEVEAAPVERPEAKRGVPLARAAAEYSQRGFDIQNAITGDPLKGWAIDGDKEGYRVDRQAVFVFEEPLDFPQGAHLIVRLKHESDHLHHTLGRFRLLVTAGKSAEESAKVPLRLEPILALAPAERSEEQQKILADYYRSIAPSLEPVRERLAHLRERWTELSSPTTLVMKEVAEPRPTFVHIRGNFLDPGRQVSAGVPAVLHSLPKDKSVNRLALAEWLVSEENPLVGRVTMNRLWIERFGRGLVETPEDFGSRGEPPTHPELLDWLATELPRQKWSLKTMHRLMVTSATYRQSSRLTPEILERDPHNRLLARGPRFRMDAEMIRDNALEIAGLLSRRMYGPSVFPPQPEGTWNVVYSSEKWQTSKGEDRYRRGLYTFWRRTTPYPAFMTFDAPSRETVCLRRVRTNTPLQALTTLNDPAFFDAARGLARRLMSRYHSAAEPIRERIVYAFRLCVARQPDEKELNRLARLFEGELARFRQDSGSAEQIALGGEVQPSAGTDLAEFAAWTMLANVLLNLDETITRG